MKEWRSLLVFPFLSSRALRLARHWGGGALNLVWPPRSLLSRDFVERPGQIEPNLWAQLTFLTEPCCACCGFPFEFDYGPGTECLACQTRKPAYDRARAALIYDEHSRPLALDLKHGGRRDGLPTFGAWLAQAAPFALEADLIAPVPLHYTRLVKRGHNQAAWLAEALTKAVQKPMHPQILLRARRTRSQSGLSGSGRTRNVQGAFRVRPKMQATLRGKRVLLVDDVFTTGATVEACARTLLRSGASAVDVVCLTRVVRPTQTPI